MGLAKTILKYMYIVATDIFHVALGFLTVYLFKYSYLSILIPIVYIMYQVAESKSEEEYIDDLMEYIIGIMLGFGYILIEVVKGIV